MTNPPDTSSGGGLEEAFEDWWPAPKFETNSQAFTVKSWAKDSFLAGARHMEAELLRERERSRGLVEALEHIRFGKGSNSHNFNVAKDAIAAYRASAKEGDK